MLASTKYRVTFHPLIGLLESGLDTTTVVEDDVVAVDTITCLFFSHTYRVCEGERCTCWSGCLQALLGVRKTVTKSTAHQFHAVVLYAVEHLLL